jgi:hypothetical protein
MIKKSFLCWASNRGLYRALAVAHVIAGPKVLSDIIAKHSLHAWIEKGNSPVPFELISK